MARESVYETIEQRSMESFEDFGNLQALINSIGDKIQNSGHVYHRVWYEIEDDDGYRQFIVMGVRDETDAERDKRLTEQAKSDAQARQQQEEQLYKLAKQLGKKIVE